MYKKLLEELLVIIKDSYNQKNPANRIIEIRLSTHIRNKYLQSGPADVVSFMMIWVDDIPIIRSTRIQGVYADQDLLENVLAKSLIKKLMQAAFNNKLKEKRC